MFICFRWPNIQQVPSICKSVILNTLFTNPSCNSVTNIDWLLQSHNSTGGLDWFINPTLALWVYLISSAFFQWELEVRSFWSSTKHLYDRKISLETDMDWFMLCSYMLILMQCYLYSVDKSYLWYDLDFNVLLIWSYFEASYFLFFSVNILTKLF